jgi:polyisoprenoid-binding protein YceI
MTESTITTDAKALTGDYTIDPSHSRIGFAARHAMVTTVRGQFGTFTGSAHLDFEQPENSRATIEIDVASVNTGNADRDNHLRSADFFDADNYPKITFTSTGVRPKSDDTYVLLGDLTVKGVTKPVEVEFEFTGVNGDPWGNTRAGFEGRTTVNRKDWGLTWNVAIETGGILVSDKVKLEFDIAAVKN